MKEGLKEQAARPSLPGTILLRHHLLCLVRKFFIERGYLEVETPQIVPCPGIDPFIDAVSVPGEFLITSPELHMKRLLAAGSGDIFQITRAFRKDERGKRHRPEFSMLEWYARGRDYEDIMKETERLVRFAACGLSQEGLLQTEAAWPEPFRRVSVDEIFAEEAGWQPSVAFDTERFFEDLVGKVDGALSSMGAVFLYDYPAPLGSLARKRNDHPAVAERFELYLDGLEVCNGFSEMTEREEYEEAFEDHNRWRRELGKKEYPVDETFLCEIDGRLPECAGNALGLDRLLMAIAGAEDIADVLPFP